MPTAITRSVMVLSTLLLAASPASAASYLEIQGTRFSGSYAGNMDADRGDGSLDVWQFDLRSALTRPILLQDHWRIVPALQYRYTDLRFSDTPESFSYGLHTLALSSTFTYHQPGSRWGYSALARGRLASDFTHITTDDFTFDVIAAAAYQYNDRLSLGFGAAAINLNGDPLVFPVVTVDWQATKFLHVGWYGPNFAVRQTVNEEWLLSLRGNFASDVWNVSTDRSSSENLNLTTYRLGLYSDHKLAENLWLSLGAGFTLANEFEFKTNGNSRILKRGLDEGFFAEISLNLAQW